MTFTDPVVWHAFIPKQLLIDCVTNAFLIGTIVHERSFICIHGIKEKNKQDEISISDYVGIWKIVNNQKAERHLSQNMLVVNAKKTNDNITFPMPIKAKFVSQQLKVQPVICIFYEPKELKLSYVLLKTQSYKYDTKLCLQEEYETVSHNIRCLDSTVKCEESINEKDIRHSLGSENGSFDDCMVNENCIVSLLNNIHCKPFILTNDQGVKNFMAQSSNISEMSFNYMAQLCLVVPRLLVYFICFLGRLLIYGSELIKWLCPWLPKILRPPFILIHIQNRAAQYDNICRLSTSDVFNRFLLYNCCCQQLVDTVLGLSIIFLIIQAGQADVIASVINNWADEAALNLTALVKWLMGAPAGLKLNAQLTKFLGHFFIYHIYLWSGYLSYLKVAMSSIIWYSSFLGIWGMSAQLCFVQDIISMLTLHIYCFYVYAARIFNLQIYTLCSLWRLFLGKKWNVLRSRVDSAPYNTDQLFVGTLIFTVLIFLLPTTALYYVVFAVLHLFVLIVKGCLQGIVKVMSLTPVFTLVARIFIPKRVAGCVRFEVKDFRNDSNTLVLDMQTCHIPLTQLFSLTSKWMSSLTPPTHTWKECLSYLVTGQLIYPWIRPAKSKSHQ